MSTYDIYARISQEGDRTEAELQEQLAIYEGACREWAERNGVEVGEVVCETDVSGSKPVDERELGRLLARIESGESAGILTPYLDRFGRDQLEGCVAWKRIADAGGRLVCVNDGLDSAQPGAKLNFQIRMAIAEDYLDRVRANFLTRIQAKAAKGAYLACKAPLGYRKDDDGRIHPDPEVAPLVARAFEMRAEGRPAREIAEYLNGEGLKSTTENGVRHLLRNQAYLGEAKVQSGIRGHPRTLQDAHEPLVTPDLFERAQAAGGPYRPNNGSLASRVRLAGLVYCGGCGKRLKVGGSGKRQDPSYLCTRGGCPARSGISARRLDGYVEGLIQEAILAGEPHAVAILEGDTRYEQALAAVEAEQRELQTWRDDVRVSDVGLDAWKAGLAAREAALDLARKALREIPAPAKKRYGGTHPALGIAGKGKRAHAERVRAVEDAMNREANGRFIARVVVKPVGKGRRVDPAERTHVYLVGSDVPYTQPEPAQVIELPVAA
jgi:DNA invertase Pin-like site-specific DNA recombinase